MSVSVTVKWGKQKFDDVAVDTAAGPDAFRAALEELTGVPADKQKLLCKKGWKGTMSAKTSLDGVTNGAVVTLIGSASRLARATEAVKFVEDLPKSELASAGAALPPGLANGANNICYLNATLQCLRAVPELDTAARDVAAGAREVPGTAAGAVTKGFGEVLARMAASTEHDPVFPSALLAPVRAAHPAFGEVAANGVPRQQDSDEFQGLLLGDLAEALGRTPSGGLKALAPALGGASRGANLVDTLMGVEVRTTMTCAEGDGAEAPTERRESQLKLVCNIQGGGGSSTKVNHVSEGMRLAMEGTIEKRSEALGRDALFTRRSRVSRLPPYLCVQFLRFFWRSNTSAAAGEPAGTKYKIKRAVAFPANGLDLFEFCDDDLQAALKTNRDKHAREDEARRAARDAAGAAASSSSSSSSSADPPAKRAKETAAGDAEEDDDLASAVEASAASPTAAAASSSSSSSSTSSSAAAAAASISGFGLPAEFEGIYELFAVVSHAGPNAESGHYTGWVRRGVAGSGCDDWLNFDDETVSPCRTEHVMELKGSGSDTGDIAYMTFYRAVQ